jgi:hypothetical protein
MRRTDLIVAVDPASGPDPSELEDIVVTLVPESWDATRLVRVVGRTRNLVSGIVVVGWSGPGELRLVRGRDVDRLCRVADLVASAVAPVAGPDPRRHPLTLTNVPDGQRLFDELATGRKVVVAELAPSGPDAVQRWLRVLAAVAERVVEVEMCDTGGVPRDRHPA